MFAVFCVDAHKRYLPADANGCLNSVSMYESCNSRTENETCSGWSLNDRRELLSDQQTADILWYFHRVVCNFEMLV